MSNCAVDLDSLLIPTLFLTEKSVEDRGRELYTQHYCGVDHRTHDGDDVKFFADRFDHAFFKSLQPSVERLKEVIDVERVTRIMWIRELISGNVPESECILVPSDKPNRPARRLYIINSEMYVTWLEPLKGGGWKFSSAYKPLASQIKKYRKSGTTIWKYGWK
jgi:hypothetical protein